MRRNLPSLTALGVFEAAARYASFTRASEELGITQSAVSRQIAQLEQFLGVRLFERVRRRVLLTEAGNAYAAKISSILDQTQLATAEVASMEADRVLHVSSLATFGWKWICPRLPSFLERHADIPIKLTAHHDRAFEFTEAGVDIAIQYGEAAWPDALLDLLMHERIVVVCSQQYAKIARLKEPRDLLSAVLLRQNKREDAWIDILESLKIEGANLHHGPQFDQYSMIIETALNGGGVAAIPDFLIEKELSSGRLIRLFAAAVRSRHAYYLVYPESKRHLKGVQCFRRWMLEEARAFRRQRGHK